MTRPDYMSRAPARTENPSVSARVCGPQCVTQDESVTIGAWIVHAGNAAVFFHSPGGRTSRAADRRHAGLRRRSGPAAGDLSGHDDLHTAGRTRSRSTRARTLNLFGHDQDLPERPEGQRPRRRQHLRPRLHRRGLRDPLQAEHGRGQAGRQAGDAERLGPAPAPRRLAVARAAVRRSPPARRRRSRRCPQGYGLKVGGDATWGLNYMIHNLTARRGRAGLHHLGDRLGARDHPGAHRHHPTTHPLARRRRRARTSTRSSTPSAASTSTATASTRSPTRSRPTRRCPATRSARTSAPPARWTVPTGGATLVFGAGHLHPGGVHVDLQVARDGPDAGIDRRR